MVAKAPSRNDDVTSQKRDDGTPPQTNGPGSPARFKGVPRGPARFKGREHARAVRAAQRAGGVKSVRIDGVEYVLGGDGPATPAADDLDKWVAKKYARHGLKVSTRSPRRSPTEAGGPIGTLGKADPRYMASPARPNSSTATTKPSRRRW